MERYVCIHCHFYQPPRENPWLEAVELQDSASPYHDWNERVTAECYLPNSASRILDEQGRIAKIVNNYARISFNFGPTLLSWMEDHAPHVYQQILEADRQSQERFAGHGAALAQAYNHMILPLANSRDKHTQIVWGMRDFQHRFRRDPEGMWLPETAVDVETLDLLSSCGIKFTLLAPHQACRFRNEPWENWISVEGGRIDPTRPYYCYLPSGRTIALFFYDGPISHAVAFENLLIDGEKFARRLLSGLNGNRSWPQLVHIATDGETYGHHHPHGDMALAYALDYIEQHQLARITNYGEYLAAHPPANEVEIIEKTSWSCAHGVGRWETDCGCNSGKRAGWRQQWRRPLRQAMDTLRDELAALYEAGAGELLSDPWAARNGYIKVVVDRSSANINAFLELHARRALSTEDQVRVLRLLEMQRHLMLMYTSCGWFFDDITGPETVQVLQYAGRAMQLAGEMFGEDRRESFLQRLQEAWSNIPGAGNGRHAYHRFVTGAMLDLVKLAAHYAISSLFDGYRDRSVYCYRVSVESSRVWETGRTKLAIGQARIVSLVTKVELSVQFAALHFGDHNLSAGVKVSHDDSSLQTLTDEAGPAFERADLPECLRVIDRHFAGAAYSLRSLCRDEQRRILSQIVHNALDDAEAVYRQVYDHHAPLIGLLSDLQIPLPPALRAASEFILASSVRRLLTEREVDLDRVRMLLDTARHEGSSLNIADLESALRQRLNTMIDQWSQRPGNLEILESAEALASLSRVPPFEVNLWKSQNVYYELLQAVSRVPLHASRAWLEHFRGLGEWLGVAVSERSLAGSAQRNLAILPEAEAETEAETDSNRGQHTRVCA